MCSLLTRVLTHSTQHKVCQVWLQSWPKWDKSGTLSDQISVMAHQNCPIWGQCDPFWSQPTIPGLAYKRANNNHLTACPDSRPASCIVSLKPTYSPTPLCCCIVNKSVTAELLYLDIPLRAGWCKHHYFKACLAGRTGQLFMSCQLSNTKSRKWWKRFGKKIMNIKTPLLVTLV